METCDFLVIGLGAMGAAALAELSNHGSVIGIEAVAPGHGGGSSHGESRIFRLSNFESPAYTALAGQSLKVWRAIETRPGEIYLRTGIIEAGAADSAIVTGRAGDPSLERMTPERLARRYPIFALPPGWVATRQREAGVLRADRAIARLLDLVRARQPGAVRSGDVVSVTQAGGGVEAAMRDGTRIGAGAAIVTTGPWITQLVPALAGRVRVTAQTIGWFDPFAGAPVGPDRMPVFAIETGGATGLLYGFPDFAGLGVKAASHAHGPAWEPGAPRPDEAARGAALAPVAAALGRLLPQAAARLRASATCLYTSTPDEEFIVDRCPERPGVVFASACSGHGFKFAPAIATMLSSLARDPDATTGYPLVA